MLTARQQKRKLLTAYVKSVNIKNVSQGVIGVEMVMDRRMSDGCM